MKKKKTYWEICLDLWDVKTWISNEDYYGKTHSPKFTSRISDMRKKGVEIIGVRSGSHFVYALITPKEDVIEIMTGKKAA